MPAVPKIRYYVDESGKSGVSERLVIAVFTIDGEEEKYRDLCGEIETKSGKGRIKYHKAKPSYRANYIHRLLTKRPFRGALAYSVFNGKTDLHKATIATIIRSAQWKEQTNPARAFIYVDALVKSKIQDYSVAVRAQGFRVAKVRGVKKDQNNPLMRVPDGIAGFVADSFEYKESSQLLERAKRNLRIIEL